MFEDNQFTTVMTKNPQFHGRVKHIDIRHHFVQEQVANGTIKLECCATTDMTADMMTKGLTHEQHCKLREKAGMFELH